MRIIQLRIIIFSIAIYQLVNCRLGHIRAVYPINLHILHLRTTHYDHSAAASAAPSAAPSRQLMHERPPSAPDKTLPLAIYVCRFTLFLFQRQFSMRSFLFSLISRIAFNIAILYPLTSQLKAYSIRRSGLYIYCLRQRLSRVVCCYSLAIL